MATASKTKPAVKPVAKVLKAAAPKAKSVAKPAAKSVKKTPDPVISEIKSLMEAGVRVVPEDVDGGNVVPQDGDSDKVQVEENTVSVLHPNVDEEQGATTDTEPHQPTELAKDVFLIAKKLCMECVHLCPETGSEAPTSCHYDAGNEDCPARITVIQLGMSRKEIEKAATAIVEATANSDFDRLSAAARRLSQKSESVRSAVSQRVVELQEQRAAQAN